MKSETILDAGCWNVCKLDVEEEEEEVQEEEEEEEEVQDSQVA
jgi:hypothetical protein